MVSEPNGNATSTNANGGSASEIPLITPPTPRCAANHPAVRHRSRQPAGGAVTSPVAPNSSRAAVTSSARTPGIKAVASSGTITATVSSRIIQTVRSAGPGASTWASTDIASQYGISSAPPRIRCAHRRQVSGLASGRNTRRARTPYTLRS